MNCIIQYTVNDLIHPRYRQSFIIKTVINKPTGTIVSRFYLGFKR